MDMYSDKPEKYLFVIVIRYRFQTQLLFSQLEFIRKMSNFPSTIHRKISYLDFLNLLKRVLEFEQSLRFFSNYHYNLFIQNS